MVFDRKKFYGTLRKLAEASESATWMLADHVRTGVQAGETQRNIAAAIGVSPTYVNHLNLTVAEFPPGFRRNGVPLSTHKAAVIAARTVCRAAEQHIGKPYQLSADEALSELLANGITQSRDATIHLIRQARKRVEESEFAKSCGIIASATDVIDRCYPGDCRLVIPKLPLGGVQIFHLDPPFGHYKSGDGGLSTGNFAAGVVGCDNDNTADALEATTDVLRALPPYLKPQGVVLLWQAAKELRAPILAALEESGLEIEMPLIWCKPKPQPCSFIGPWDLAAEFAWVIKHRGAQLINYDNSSRSQVLSADDYPPVRHSVANFIETHPYQKPENLSEMFINKHSQPSDLVADLFGCSGSFCIAAARRGRHFVYAESNADNFAFGSKRIEAEMRKNKSA